MWTEQDDKEIEYGKWHVYTAKTTIAEERKVHPLKAREEIWPHWNEGVPTKLRVRVTSPDFYVGRVYHRRREYYLSVDLTWNSPRSLSALTDNYGLLPDTHQNEWSGVYRLFSKDTTIERLCGKDPTGTLYLGCAGTGEKSWSILRTRIMAVAKGDHHAMNYWRFNRLTQEKYPWKSLAVEWAFTGQTYNYEGKLIPQAFEAEGLLLGCYKSSYGELPPWNEKP